MIILYKLSIILLLFLGSIPCYSQIGIYNETPDVSSVLDITATSKGMLLPSMTTAQKLAIVKPANSLLVYDTDQQCVSQNIGTETNPEWTCLTDYANYFFYMPSINISTENVGATTNIDLFQIYKNQYTAPQHASTGAPIDIPHYITASDLFYYVTYNDPTRIRINNISATGVMNYTVLKKANHDTYMNIVFVTK